MFLNWPDALINEIRTTKATADDTGRRSGEAALAAAVLAAEAATATTRYHALLTTYEAFYVDYNDPGTLPPLELIPDRGSFKQLFRAAREAAEDDDESNDDDNQEVLDE